ncbi:uncharacterized protein L201_004960 [Kwoniella dendrophila CBS 6074]|uniref:Uncharacterized protein n=1 Tax=Kwoniella dendrophila CBS 6074 TaxID=1295534 RepID=A0AAX4JZR3_9TREE
MDFDFINDIWDVISACFTKRPPHSPNLEAQEGELETLLVGSNEGWDDQDGILLSTPRIQKERQAKGLKPSKPMKNPLIPKSQNNDYKEQEEELPPSYDAHLNAAGSSSLPISMYGTRSSRPVSGYSTEFENEIDEDAKSLSVNPQKLAELAKQFEPTLTLEDIRKEEEEQAERERKAERAAGLDIYSPPILKENRQEEIDDDFGEFEQATTSKGNRIVDNTN